VFDWYFWNDEGKEAGWNRRMILDAWTMPDRPAQPASRRNDGPFTEKDQFLYDPGDRKWASNLREIINWQFSDLSADSPFRYHSVRSLGYLLYSICHVQNRLRCKFTASMFEQLMVLMRIKSQDDMQRALSVNLVDYGFVDDSIQFIPAAERYQVNAQLAKLGLDENQNLINRNASSYTAKISSSQSDQIPTATQYMGEEAKVTQLVGAGLAQAYEYQKPEYLEIFRRFTRKHSTDPEVLRMQTNCLKAGVPPEVLYNLASWEIEPERIIGSGNRTLEMMTSDWLINHLSLYSPDAQEKIKRLATLSMTDDSALADVLVPEQQTASNSILDAESSAASLLLALPTTLKLNVNHGEYCAVLLSILETEIVKIASAGGVPESPAVLLGLQNLSGLTVDGKRVPGNNVAGHLELFEQAA